MTRKHFIQFADEIFHSDEWYTKVQRETILRMLKRSNPNFDEDRFRMRAGWSE